MLVHPVRVHPSADRLPREEQLAWRIAQVAADPVPVDDDVAAMVVNRVIDDAAVAAAALALLGVGWNFMFVSATTMLSAAHDPAERVRAQAANDLIVFGTVACTAFLSGAVHAGGGWAALNLSILPPLAVAAGLLAWQRWRHRPATTAAAARPAAATAGSTAPR